MTTVLVTRWVNPRSLPKIIVNLLPLWLLSIAITVEGFPRPPISGEVAVAAFVTAIVLSVVLLWTQRLDIAVLANSLFPLLLLSVFDEISTTYKTPFIFLCALILSLGVMAYQSKNSPYLVRILILLAVAGAAWVLAWHATLNFWEMTRDLGYVRCFPDAFGCAPLTGQETPWWVLFFGP